MSAYSGVILVMPPTDLSTYIESFKTASTKFNRLRDDFYNLYREASDRLRNVEQYGRSSGVDTGDRVFGKLKSMVNELGAAKFEAIDASRPVTNYGDTMEERKRMWEEYAFVMEDYDAISDLSISTWTQNPFQG